MKFITKMNNWFTVIVLVVIPLLVKGQQHTNCNRETDLKMFIPNDVCIPNGKYQITQVDKENDVDGDNKKDLVIEWNNMPIKDGDTIFVSIYLQNKDSAFTFFRTFNNLYPIFFKSYDLSYMPRDTSLNTIYKKYEGEYLMLDLIFKKGKIVIRRKNDATSEFFITYKYDKKLKNWIYEKCEMYDFTIEKTKPYDLSDKLGGTINNFTYFIWD